MGYFDAPDKTTWIEGRSMKNAIEQRDKKSRKYRVLVEFDQSLLERADRSAREGGTTRSELIRRAVSRCIEELDAKELEKCLEAGYKANADISLKISGESSKKSEMGTGWVNIKDRVPDYFEDVLVWWPQAGKQDLGPPFRVAQFGPSGWRSEPNLYGEIADSGRGLPEPTHWMRPEVPDME